MGLSLHLLASQIPQVRAFRAVRAAGDLRKVLAIAVAITVAVVIVVLVLFDGNTVILQQIGFNLG